MVIRMRMILSETRTTSNTSSHHSSARRTPTPPVPLSFPDQKSLKRDSFPTICLTPSIFHLVSWRQHRSTLLLDTVSTTSLAFCFIVPTLSVPTRKDFGHLLDSPPGPDPAAPHPRAAKLETLPTTLWLPAPPKPFLWFWLVMNICSMVLWPGCPSFQPTRTLYFQKQWIHAVCPSSTSGMKDSGMEENQRRTDSRDGPPWVVKLTMKSIIFWHV